MNQWEKDFTTTKIIVSAIYGSIFIYAGLIYFGIPSVPYRWEQTQQILFFVLLAAAIPIFLISAFIGKQQMSSEKLTKRFRSAGGGDNGLSAAIALVRTGAVIMAAIGEACAVYGVVLYFLSGDLIRPLILLALSVIHFPLTMMRLSKAREAIERLLYS